jgi:hypothetical protein
MLIAPAVLISAANEVIDRLHFGSWRWLDSVVDFMETLCAAVVTVSLVKAFGSLSRFEFWAILRRSNTVGSKAKK